MGFWKIWTYRYFYFSVKIFIKLTFFKEFKKKSNIETAVNGITSCLIDGEIPVRVKAAVALNCLLLQKDAEDLLRPALPKILEIYIKLMDVIDNDGIVEALEVILKKKHNIYINLFLF